MNPARINYKVYQGSTFEEVFRWESATKSYAAIGAIPNVAPCRVIVGMTDPTPPPQWRIRITGVAGMKEINLVNEEDYYLSTGITGTNNNEIIINSINAANFSTYTSGGIVSWNIPVPLSNYTGAMQIRENIDSTVLLELTTANGGIVINPTDYTITVKMTSAQTTAFTFSTAVYSLELTNTLSGKVTTFLIGNLSLVREVTR
jgi:hypothetical protein